MIRSSTTPMRPPEQRTKKRGRRKVPNAGKRVRAAIDRTGSFAADTTYDLCVGTDPPLGSEAPLSSLADRLVLLAPSGAGADRGWEYGR